MLNALTDQLQGAFSKLKGKKKLTEENITEAVREVRMALLEADVNYGVTKTLVKRIKEKALGEEVLKSVTPGQQFIDCVHQELVRLMGEGEPRLSLSGQPAVILVCGLQGSGKTTFCGKLAKWLKSEKGKKKPLLVACDLQRPAAIDQLHTIGKQAEVDVYSEKGMNDPVGVAKNGLQRAKSEMHDVVIFDTAGRLHIDDALMNQLSTLKEAVKPEEILFVSNATIGQDAVNVAKEFNDRMEMTGTVLTMLDGNTRGGAAISIYEVTGKPLKFEGIGEGVDDLQLFNPQSMADRILGMGDTINLVRKAREHMDEDEAKKLEKKMRKAGFTYLDYLKQIQMVKKMGSLKSLMGMLPGMNKLKELDLDDAHLFKVEAMILSMTGEEREERVELVPSRRRRIARGSGTSMDDVNRLVKSFKQAKQFFKNMPNMKQMEKMMGGASWR